MPIRRSKDGGTSWPGTILIVLVFIASAAGVVFSAVQDFGTAMLAFAVPLLLTTPLITILLQGGTATWMMAFMFSAFVLIPMPLVAGILGLTIGPEMLMAAMLFEISAEATPPGKWNLVQLKPEKLEPGQSPGLQHSSIYENREALAVISDWVKARVEMTPTR